MKGLNRSSYHLSNFSYTLYVVHFPLLQIVSINFLHRSNILDGKSILIFTFLVLILNVISFIIYKLFESHTLNVKRFIKKKLSIDYANNAKYIP